MPSPRIVAKGWIRNAILDSLSKSPSTLTSLARDLGVSKSTIDYHLRRLLERRLIQISETRIAKGGIVSKLYSLGNGAVVLMPTPAREGEELRHLDEAFEIQTLAWASKESLPDGQEMRSLLYRLFLHLFMITRSQHQPLLHAYGRRAGAVVARVLTSRGRTATLMELIDWMRRNGVASAEMVDVSDSQSSILMINDCLGSGDHPSRACWFLEGLVDGVVQSRLGGSFTESRLDEPGIPSCCLVVGRGRNADNRLLREALLSSPLRTEGRRSIGRRG